MTDLLVSTIQQLLPAAITGFISGVIGVFAWSRFFRKKERRLFKNIRRPIIVIGTEDKPMEHEFQLLERVGFFNLKYSSESRVADLLNGNRLVILGYSPNSETFKNIFITAKQKEIPVIVYAGPTRITGDDMELLQNYSHHSMCNTPLRLVSDVFALMGTYPEDDR